MRKSGVRYRMIYHTDIFTYTLWDSGIERLTGTKRLGENNRPGGVCVSNQRRKLASKGYKQPRVQASRRFVTHCHAPPP